MINIFENKQNDLNHKPSIHNYDFDSLTNLKSMVSNLSFDDVYLASLFIIGLAMVTVSLFVNKKKDIKYLFFYIKNYHLIMPFIKKKFISLFVIGIVIFIINIFLYVLGLNVSVSTETPILFCYTLFCKAVSIKLVFALILSFINKDFKVEYASLSLFSVVCILFIGAIHYYYVVPFVEASMLLSLTKFYDKAKCVALFFEKSITNYASGTSITKGIYSIIHTLPIIGKYLPSLTKLLYQNNNNDMYSPFRIHYTNVLKHSNNIYPLGSISKFIPVVMPAFVENRAEVSYSYNGNISHLELLLKKNSIYFRDLISNFVFNYSNLSCKVNLICIDQIISIHTIFKNGNLEVFNLEKTHLHFKKSTFDSGSDDRSSLLKLTNPVQSANNLMVNMQDNIIYNNPNLTDPNLMETHFEKGESSNTSKGRKRKLESDNLNYPETQDHDENFLSIKIHIGKMQEKDFLFLDFDVEKLKNDDRYLEEICSRGRRNLIDHYNNSGKTMEESIEIANNFKLDDISMNENIDSIYVKFYKALLEKYKNSVDMSNLSVENIKPFSEFLLNKGSIDNSSSRSESDAISNNYREIEKSGLTLEQDLKQNTLMKQEMQNIGLTTKEVNILLMELKERVSNLFTERESDNNNSIACSFKDINLTKKNKVLVNRSTLMKDQFTELLMQLAENNKSFFINRGPFTDILASTVTKVYSNLIEFIRKPLSNNEISVIINKLEDMKKLELNNRKKLHDSRINIYLPDLLGKSCSFVWELQIGPVDESGPLEESDTDFCRLFEYLLQEWPKLNEKFSTKNVNVLISELKERVEV